MGKKFPMKCLTLFSELTRSPKTEPDFLSFLSFFFLFETGKKKKNHEHGKKLETKPDDRCLTLFSEMTRSSKTEPDLFFDSFFLEEN